MEHYPVIIIGAGVSGMCQGIFLDRIGVRYKIIEKGNDIGGTWRDNVYPGAACDVQAYLYSYSFEQNPNWSKRWPDGEEIQEYFRGVARKYNLYARTNFNEEIVQCTWQEAEQQWRVESARQTYTCRFLVSCVGMLNRPFTPQIPGRELFRGKQMHTAKWESGYDVRGKRVAVIGTAASAAQLMPEIVGSVAKLDAYQRTPNYYSAYYMKPNSSISGLQHLLNRFVPGLLWVKRMQVLCLNELFYQGVFVSKSGNEKFKQELLRFMRTKISSPELQEKMTPNYPPGCKRIIFSDNFYEAVNSPNFTLYTEPIEALYEDGLVSGGQRRAYDLIVYATGFQTKDFISPLLIRGRGGKRLFEDKVQGYYGITGRDFPNLFLTAGPTSARGSTSVIFMIECQVEYIRQCIQFMLENRQLGSLEIDAHEFEEFNREQQIRLKDTVWNANCLSWYKHDGVISNNWEGSIYQYWKQTLFPKFEKYVFRDKKGHVTHPQKPSLFRRLTTLFCPRRLKLD